jgi:hypothetical protein
MCYEELVFFYAHSISKHDGVFGGTVLGVSFEEIGMHQNSHLYIVFMGVMV